MPSTSRVAVYCRVSTSDQRADLQLHDLRRLAEQRGWKVVGEYIDEGYSGTKDRRPALDKLMADAHKRRFDVVAVWRFDRFARSVRHLLVTLDDFRERGIDFLSMNDSVDTSTPTGRMMFADRPLVTVSPAPSPTVRGKATLAGEADSSGIDLTLSGATTVHAVTDETGGYALTNVPPGTYTLVAVAKSTREGSKVATLTVASSGAAEAPTLEFTPLGELTGTVTLGKETGNAGIAITVPGTPAVAITDDAGKWTLADVVTGVRDVVAWYPGFASGSLKGVMVRYNASTATDSLVLAKAPLSVGAISGRAVLTGESDSSSIIVTATGPTSAVAIVGTDGSWKLTGLPDGVYVVTAAAASSAEGTRSATVAIKDGVEVVAPELAFTPLGTVTGKVTLGSATGNAGITVLLSGTAASGTTDDAGNYTIKSAPSGSRDLIASRVGYDTRKSDGLAVKYNASVAAPDLVLVKAKAGIGKIDGRALLTGESDSKGIALTLSGPVSGAATTSSSGAYSFADLPDGTYTVIAVAASTLEGTKTVTVEVKDGGAVTAADVAFTGVGTIIGKATLGSATTGNGGILVFAAGGSAPVYTDDAGNYALKNVPTTSSWTINASQPGYTTGTATVAKVPYAATTSASAIALTVDPLLSGSVVSRALLAGAVTHGGTTVTLGVTGRTTVTSSAGDYSFDAILKGGMYSLDFANGALREKLPNVLVLPGASGFLVEGTGTTYAMEPLEIQRAPRIFGVSPAFRTVTPDGNVVIVLTYDASASTKQLWSLAASGGDNRLLASDANLGLAAVAPDSTRVVYRNDSTREFWSVPVTGGTPVKLLTLPSSGYGGGWITPDSKKFVIWPNDSTSGRYDFVTVDLATGVSTTLLSKFIGQVSTSPDKTKFVLSKNGTSAIEYYVVDASAGTSKPLNAGGAYALQISPNGAKVVVNRTGIFGWQLAIIDVATGTERIAASSSTIYSYRYGEWTPDSAYYTWPDSYLTQELKSVRASDGVMTVLAALSEPLYAVDGGRWYTCVPTDVVTCSLTQLRPDGTRATVDSVGTRGVSGIWLSPDGKTVVWSSNEATAATLNIAPAAGGSVVRVPNVSSVYQYAADGKHLLLRTTTGQYIVATTDGSESTVTLPWGSSVDAPRFSADGAKLAYRVVKGGKAYAAWSPIAGIAAATPTFISRTIDFEWAGSSRVVSYLTSMASPFTFQNGVYVATLP